MEQKKYPIKTALSIACDIFDKQGYVKEVNPGKDVDTNKSVLSKRLDKEDNFVHSNIEDILSYRQELIFKKLSGKLSEYEHIVIKTLDISYRFVSFVVGWLQQQFIKVCFSFCIQKA